MNKNENKIRKIANQLGKIWKIQGNSNLLFYTCEKYKKWKISTTNDTCFENSLGPSAY